MMSLFSTGNDGFWAYFSPVFDEEEADKEQCDTRAMLACC